MQVVSAKFLVSNELREQIFLRRRSFASAVVPSLIVARENGADLKLYLGFNDPKVLLSEDPIFLVRFDDGLELLILQEELLQNLEGSTVGIKNGMLSIYEDKAE